MVFKCKISSCAIEFKLSSSLKRHLRKIHDTEPDPKPGKYMCEICSKKFSSHFNLKRHKKLKHNILPDIRPEAKYKTICPSCKLSLRSYKELLSHCHTLHDLKEDKEEHAFASMKEFAEWKNRIEKETYSMYKKQTSAKHLKQSIVTYYRCHRSGFFKSRSLNKRSMKSQGSCKINSTCPSFLKTITSSANSTVKVILWKAHLGHSLDLTHLVINSEERAKIAGKIAEGVTFDRIIGDARNQIYSQNCFLPEHLITRHDLRNFKRDYNTHFEREHIRSKNITPQMIEEESDITDENFSRSWKVQSDLSPLNWYTVHMLSDPICTNACQLRCIECLCCLHMYSCSCPDNLMKHKMCRHIHACAMLSLLQAELSFQQNNQADTSELDHILNSLNNQNIFAQSVGNLNGNICKKVEYLIGLISNLKYDQKLLNKITKGLDSVIEIALQGTRDEAKNDNILLVSQNEESPKKKLGLNFFNQMNQQHQQIQTNSQQNVQSLQAMQQMNQQHVFLRHQQVQQSQLHPQQFLLQQHSIHMQTPQQNNLILTQLQNPQQQLLQQHLTHQRQSNINTPIYKAKIKKNNLGIKSTRKSASLERLNIIENLKNNHCSINMQPSAFEQAYLFNQI